MKTTPSLLISSLYTFASLFLFKTYGADFRVKALVVDPEGNPEMYATWRIFPADSSSVTPIIGNQTDQLGSIDAPLDSAGDYRLSILGMNGGSLDATFAITPAASVADLGTLTLTSSLSQQLDEITVTAQRPLVVKEIDRLAYDVQADPETPTAPLIDILRKVPLVSVDGEGNISVNGSSEFKIYKNGRPNNSFTKNAKELFKAIPASSIKKIEVITDPGAREDAEGVGAILNIITDSDSALEGITGSVNLFADTNNPLPLPRIWLSSQLKKVTFSLYANYYNMSHRESDRTSHSESVYHDTGRRLSSNGTTLSHANSGSSGFELSYELDTLNLFTASMDLFYYNSKNKQLSSYTMTDANGNLLQSYNKMSFYPTSHYLDIDGNINYQRSTRRKNENITLSYQVSTTGQKQKEQTDYTDLFNFPVDYNGIFSNFDLRFIEHTFQADWTRPIASKHTLDVGAKYIARRNHSKNRRDYINSHQTYDDFYHNTDIAAAYADFHAKFGKVGFRGGFRYEYSHLAAKFRQGDGSDFSSSINDYVPNITISYSPNDISTLKLSFNRRISRPGISYLDPTVSSTPQSTSTGNPHLKSTNFNNLYFNYGFIKLKFNLDLSINYTFCNDGVAKTLDVKGDHLYYSFANTAHYRTLTGSVYAQWSPGEKTQIRGSFYTSYVWQSLPTGESVHRPIYNPWATVQQTLPKRFRLTANVGWWSGAVMSAYSYMKPTIAYFWNNLNLQKFFLSEDRLSLGLNIQNPFGPYKRKSVTVTDVPEYYSESTNIFTHNFSIGLTASYRFGSLKASVKKTASSISNDDLQGRKN